MPNRPVFRFITYPFNIILLLIISVNGYANNAAERISLSNQVQQLLKVNSENIDGDVVQHLSAQIIKNRLHYASDVIAKVFLLSAKVASNESDINNVVLFSKKGLAINSVDKAIKLSLLLKLAEGYAAKKQYKPLLELTQLMVKESHFSTHVKYYLIALSYRSTAYAALGDYHNALEDLKNVEQGIDENDFAEHIELLTVLALAYHQLSDYKISLAIQLKILKLRFKTGVNINIEQTYLYLGYTYFYLGRLDDAYNAFWEAKNLSITKDETISVALANKGLGIVLLIQEDFIKALPYLKSANETFYQNNMLSNQIETSTVLAQAKLKGRQTVEAYALLMEVVKLLDGEDISLEYTFFYKMVAEMYFVQNDYHSAYQWLMKHSQILSYKFKSNKKASKVVKNFPRFKVTSIVEQNRLTELKTQAVTLASKHVLPTYSANKPGNERLIVISLSFAVFSLVLILFGLLFRVRAKQTSLTYAEVNPPSYAMPDPMKTKAHYQLSFKKARNFQYSLSVGYIVIDNWEALLFHCTNKTIAEVTKDIATVINQQVTEFDYAGLLSEGKYLLLFEHQDNAEVSEKLAVLVQAINTRAFTSLGNFSVTMKYSLNTPDFKDIDPYLFLSHIAESIDIKQVNPSK